jgi:hypothetical protein
MKSLAKSRPFFCVASDLDEELSTTSSGFSRSSSGIATSSQDGVFLI